MPNDITEDVLEDNICKALSLTGVNVIPNAVNAGHWMKSFRQSYSQIQMLQVKEIYYV